MAYDSALEKKLARKMTRAIVNFDLIEDGDRVMVGLSGGKDSWALMQLLDALRRRAPVRFTLVAVNVDSGYRDYQHDRIAQTCEERGWEYRIEHTSIGGSSMTSWMRGRRRARCAPGCGAASCIGWPERLGRPRSRSDITRTTSLRRFSLTYFFAGALKAMLPRLVSDDRRHVVIRPLVYVSEEEARDYTQMAGLPVIGCCCPVCGDLSLQRQRVKRLARPRARAFRHQTIDADGPWERGGSAPARPASQPGRRAARRCRGAP